jgi:hypothetical protein
MVPTAAAHSDLRYILDRATAEFPGERHLSVYDLLEDLRRLREGLPLRSRPATAAYVAQRFLRRNWAVTSLATLLVLSLAGGWWRAERASRRASAAAIEAWRQHQAAVANEKLAQENAARAASNAEEAVFNATRLDGLVADLIDDDDSDPNIVAQQQEAAKKSLTRAAASLETLPGPPRWHELSIAWRRVAMILVHKGEFTAAEEPLRKARDAAERWLRQEPSPAARRNSILVKLCQLRFERQRGTPERGYRLAKEALQQFRGLPGDMQAELNGTVWLESARLSMARELINQNRLDAVPALFTQVVRNSHARGLTQTRNLAVANLVWSFRRLNRLEDARHWCSVAREWQVAELRIAGFCAEPLVAFTERDDLFPASAGVLGEEDLRALQSRIGQLILDRHEDPRSFPLHITLGRAYARLAEHYFGTGEIDLARPAVRQAVEIRDALIAADSQSPVVLRFARRVEALEKTLNTP